MSNQIPSPRENARFYFDRPAAFALAVDEPWWWPVFGLGTDYINVHFETAHRGPLAIVSREQRAWHRKRDSEAIEAILKAEGRTSWDAYRCPRAAGRVVGLVNVVDCVTEPPKPTSWFVGPY